MKHQSYQHTENSQLICCANQLTGFYMELNLALNELIIRPLSPIVHDECQINEISKNQQFTNFSPPQTQVKLFHLEGTLHGRQVHVQRFQ